MRPASSPSDEPQASSACASFSAIRLACVSGLVLSGLLVPLIAVAVGAASELSSPVSPSVSPTDAMKSVDAALAKTPNDPQLRFRKGVLLAEQKRSAEAIAVFRKLADDFPLVPEPQNNLAVLYAERNEPDKARAALEAALRTRPTYDTIYRNLGTVNARIAGAAYARALNIDDSKSTVARLTLVPAWASADATSTMALAQAPTSTSTSTFAPTASAPTAVARTTPAAVLPPPVTVAAAPAAPTPASPSTPQPAPKTAPTVVAAAPTPAPVAAPKPATASAPAVVATAPAASKPALAPVLAAAPAAKPTVTPAVTAATAAATTATTATTAPRASAEEAAIRKAVQDWARAWSAKQTDAYIGTYAPGFSGNEGSASAWQAARRVRIAGKKDIDVGVSDLKIARNQNKWSASFTQSYSADSLSLVSRKTLDFESRGGRWLIVRENNGKGR